MAVRLWAGRIFRDRGDRWFIRLNDGTRIYCNQRQETFYSRQEAERCLATEIQPEIGKPSFDITFWQKTKKSVKSFETYADEWLANCEARLARKALSPGYLREIRRYLKTYFLPFFQEMDLQEIRGHDLTRFYSSLVGLSEKTTYNVMAVLRKLFRDAYYEEVIPSLPRFPRLSLGPEPQTLWADEEQLEQIFKFLSPDDYFFILFAYAHACRTGEVRALQHRDIDLEHDLVVIRRAFSGTTLREFTKTKRIVPKPLDPGWKQLYLARPRVLDPKGFVFLRNGKPWSETWGSKKFKEAATKAGFPDLCFKDGSRHSLASQAGSRGESLQAIQAFLGHSNPKQTIRYTKLNTDALKRVQRRFSANFLQIDFGRGK